MGECFFWYRPTWVVPDQRPLNGCVCVCVCYCTLLMIVSRPAVAVQATLASMVGGAAMSAVGTSVTVRSATTAATARRRSTSVLRCRAATEPPASTASATSAASATSGFRYRHELPRLHLSDAPLSKLAYYGHTVRKQGSCLRKR